ncbi:hypothetical protein [Salimicrobium flavidum]|uniref:Uncharacterized protein n=1 Tax=Salimicrobium flavidum TaxID=570947 RepID=A0A1N7JXH4_9BACI|nr:hypothetical protein [Salimicrobium flavidum]SIS53946.1 hypothetical protein SAMN05421687_10820 [Salimicrobium flavidum]
MKTITIEHYVQGPTPNNGGAYRVLSAKKDGNRVTSDMAAENVIDFIVGAVGTVANYDAIADDYTIELPAEVTLTAALETHLTDKLESDPLITSVTFA